MGLLHVFDSLALGGTERVVLNRARAAERRNAASEIDFHVPDASPAAIAMFETAVAAMGLARPRHHGKPQRLRALDLRKWCSVAGWAM